MKILGVRWFNGCGIVRVEDQYEGIKYYIKAIPFEDHFDFSTEEQDKMFVAEGGLTFPNDAGDVLFGVK